MVQRKWILGISLLCAVVSIVLFSGCHRDPVIVPANVKPAFNSGNFALQVRLLQASKAVSKPLTVLLYYFDPRENVDDVVADIRENYLNGDGDETFTVDSTNYDRDGSFWVNIESASIVVFDVYDEKFQRIALFPVMTTGQVHSVTKELK